MPIAVLENLGACADDLLARRELGLPVEHEIIKARIRAEKMKKDTAEAYCLLGVIAFVEGNKPEVRSYFKKALAFSGNLQNIRANYAGLLLEMGERAEAISQIEAVLNSPSQSIETLKFVLSLCSKGLMDEQGIKAAGMLRKMQVDIPLLPLVTAYAAENSSHEHHGQHEQEIEEDPFTGALFALAERIQKRVPHVDA